MVLGPPAVFGDLLKVDALVRFTGQVWPGDELTLTGRVERAEDSDGVRLAHLVLTVTRQTGDPAITATVQIG